MPRPPIRNDTSILKARHVGASMSATQYAEYKCAQDRAVRAIQTWKPVVSCDSAAEQQLPLWSGSKLDAVRTKRLDLPIGTDRSYAASLRTRFRRNQRSAQASLTNESATLENELMEHLHSETLGVEAFETGVSILGRLRLLGGHSSGVRTNVRSRCQSDVMTN
eukprot:TRINITY_DN8488_c0_g1_i3.p1 TRINITY_DN8488_c0_g1~~TRINITY_DN8488_c0_g1_i3.p1  ORF type:complete len:180 (+),score=7.55 TRINITY_DN8488_c0_g1_i3:51-542(+)